MSWNKMDTYKGATTQKNAIDEPSSPETLELFRKAQDNNWLLGIPAVNQRAGKADDAENVSCGEQMPSAEDYAPSCAYKTIPKSYPRAKITVGGNLTALSAGYLFTSGPRDWQMIMTSTGDPVYVRQDRVASILTPTQNGDLLSWPLTQASQDYEVLGPDYALRHRFHAPHGIKFNWREFLQTEKGTGLLFEMDIQLLRMEDLVPPFAREKIKGAIGVIIHEISVEGEVVMEWRSWDHLLFSFWEAPLFIKYENLWDLLHQNSLDEDDDGNILLSMRRTSQIAKIDRDTGEVLWRLGGRGGNFKIVNDKREHFDSQHDVRSLGNNRISIFDNGIDTGNGTARGLEYDLYFDSDGRPTEARLVNEYDTGIYAFAMGSYRQMPNGNRVYCLGHDKNYENFNPFYIETDPQGRELIRMDWMVKKKSFIGTYRTGKGPWVAIPKWRPTALLDDNNPTKTLRLHFLWNGATEVKKWRIMMGNSDGEELTEVFAEVEKKQFEHWIDVPQTKKCQYFQAAALDAKGKEMSRSPTVHTKPCS
uniref:Uncharacterized protein n=1 Tax=Vitrella brassicaformis TaxID=1169539 RepID=A0A7S1NX41_9ALVE|mmetsp:Transcript_14768/g.35220  ORF Transcript_14768/g.35220 Transcript_14768/m.35220 type:complete len:534 (+) Transcript_14768:229-1830(+)